MLSHDDGMPKDPFGSESAGADLTQWAANCRGMYMSLVGAGFTPNESLRFSIDVMAAIMTKRA